MATETKSWPNVAIPPGETLGETIEAYGLTQADLARRTGRPVQAINEIIRGSKEITPETALQLERVLGVPAHVWVRLEADYRFTKALLEDQQRLREEVQLAVGYPYAEMARFGWVPSTRNKRKQAEQLLQFFGVVSLRMVAKQDNAAFRRSMKVKSSRKALEAWLRQGERQAQNTDAGHFDARSIRAILPTLRDMTRQTPKVFEEKLKAILAQNGVALVLVPHLSKTGVQGATRWAMGKAIIQLSLRYKWADVFWFGLFHELGHLLLHGRRKMFIKPEKGLLNEFEKAADRYASDQLVPPGAYRAFVEGRTVYSADAVKNFSGTISIAPAVVVGRLQHDGYISYANLNGLRSRFEWASGS